MITLAADNISLDYIKKLSLYYVFLGAKFARVLKSLSVKVAPPQTEQLEDIASTWATGRKIEF